MGLRGVVRGGIRSDCKKGIKDRGKVAKAKEQQTVKDAQIVYRYGEHRSRPCFGLRILFLLSAPRIWHGLKTGKASIADLTPATRSQQIVMGASYVSLCGLLLWLVTHIHSGGIN